MTPNRAIYALYSGGEFISWLYGAFAQLVTEPKVYWYDGSDSQTQIVKENATYKISSLDRKSRFGLSIVDEGQDSEKERLKAYSSFQLGAFYLHENEISLATLENIKQNGPTELIDLVKEELPEETTGITLLGALKKNKEN